MIDPTMFAGGGTTGAMQMQQLEELQKALTAGYGTDVATLTGGGALRVQSLDTTMQATIQQNDDFKLFNRLAKPHAGATVDEWTEMNGVGGFLGGTTNTETGVINPFTGSYARRVGLVKYLMTQRQVSLVQTLQTAIADSEAIEYSNGALQLLTDAEYLMFEGDSTVVPTEFDGIYAQLAAGVASGQVDPRNIIDARASSMSDIGLINTAAATVRQYGNFGKPTDIFMSLQVQADFDTGLSPAFRVPLTNVGNAGIELGAPVIGIRTSHGNVKTNDDIFIRDEEMKQPFELSYGAIATANVALQPASVVGTPGANATSTFSAVTAGNYYYAVAGVNAAGQSTVLVSAQVAVAAGQRVSLVITRSTGAAETGYVIYRSQLNGGNSVAGTIAAQGSDFREMARIGVAGATTTYFDNNTDIPGTAKAFILNMLAGATAITWRQLLPMVKFPLYPTNSAVIPWAQLLFGYLRISKRRQHVVIKNILPNGNLWRPFGAASGV
jgi:hypothetical protein